ncbi:MAG: DUF1565 domain-containing protein [Phaeodactylibacter sp.]|nr:DUF1565 domain-containing protein [Phaeodactylibacter sp.]MCB9276244.1 DUF1565 domain-containing protein [Lewinellaceae bacterium]
MKRVALLTVLVLALCQVDAKVIYVKLGGNGNGTSWEHALGSVQEALQRAKSGDQIWVAAGTYFTTTDNDRTKSFIIFDGLSLFGGFSGTETSIAQRNVKQNPTYLSGEIGTASRNDNAYTVVYTENVSASTVIDGFTIANGSANGSDESRYLEIGGAGWFNLASNGHTSSPKIQDCTFTQNAGRQGAAIYNHSVNNGNCKPTIQNCTFLQNKADFDGGAIMNYSESGDCSPKIMNCNFLANEATYGAGVYNKAKSGKASPYMQNCLFKGNIAYIRDSGVHNARSEGSCEAILAGCRFEQNTAAVGSGEAPSQFSTSTQSTSTSGY